MSYRAVLKIRSFRTVLIAQILSKAGDMLTSMALPMLIYHKTGSAVSMALMMVAFWVPNLLFGPFFGMLTDRLDRKKLLVWTDLLRAALVALIPFSPMLSLYLLCFLIACAGQIFNLAKVGVTTQLVERERLVEANSLVQSCDQLLSLGGPMLAGGLIVWLGLSWPFVIDMGSFLLSALLLAFTSIPKLEPRKGREGFWEKSRNDFREGFSYVKSSAPLKFSMSLFVFVMMFAMPFNVLFFPLFQGELGADSRAIGLASSLFGVGTLLGTLVAPRLNKHFNRVHLILIGLMMIGLSFAFVALSEQLWAALIFYTAGSFFNGFINPLNASLRQENTPDHLMGRVSGMYQSAVNSLSLVTMLCAGVLAERIGVREIYLIAGLGYAATALLGRLSPWYRATSRRYQPTRQEERSQSVT
jgi:MFS transporter, DHA3 family, macrolide efflux protein